MGRPSETILVLDTSSDFVYGASFHKKSHNWAKSHSVLISLSQRKIIGKESCFWNELKINGDLWLSSLIEYLLKKEKIKKFDYIALGKGPGFFTSLRIGHVTSATLALLWDVPTIHFFCIPFWRDFFCLNRQDTFVLRANRNLYYIAVEDQLSIPDGFQAVNLDQLFEFIHKRSVKKIFLWQESWKNRVNRLNKNQTSMKVQEVQDDWGHLKKSLCIKDLSVEEVFHSHEDFIPDFLKTDNIQNMRVEIQNFLPLYGHEI